MSKKHVILNQARCKGCLLCVEVCPNGLFIQDPHPTSQGVYPVQMVDTPYCIDCLRCVDICPEGAFFPAERSTFNWEGYIYWLSRKVTLNQMKKNET